MKATNLVNLFIIESDGSLAKKIGLLVKSSFPKKITIKSFQTIDEALYSLNNGTENAVLYDLDTCCERITDLLPRMRRYSAATPLILIASPEKESIAISAIGKGAQDYLIRDRFSAEWLMRCVRAACERQRVIQELEDRSRECYSHEARFLNTIIHKLDGIIVTDSARLVQFVNPSAEKLLSCPAAQMLGKPLDTLYPACMDGEMTIRRRNDSVVVESRIVETQWKGKEARIVSLRDVTARRKAEEALRKSEERYALAVNGSNDGLWDWNLITDEIYFSPRWKDMLGLSHPEIGNRPDEWFTRVHPEDLDRLRMQINNHLGGQTHHLEHECRMIHSDGRYRWMLIRGTVVRDEKGKAIRIAGSQSDITERKEAEKSLRQALDDLKFALASEKVLLEELDRRNKELVALAITDGLTGLYNHRFIQERFDFEFKRARRYGTKLCCMLIDIDHFKSINDTYGHQFGDLVLRQIAEILRGKSREVDICGRYGGEEFMIITNQSVEGALKYATKLHTAVENHTFHNKGRKARVTVSIGIAAYGREITHKQGMIERADMALYQAKEDGRNLIRVWKEQEVDSTEALDKGGIKSLKSKFDLLHSQMRITYMDSTNALLRAVDAKDHYTQEHSQNVSRYAVALAARLGLSDEEVDILKYAGLLHDVGKIGVDEAILRKEEALTQEEYAILKKHPVIGVSILHDVKFLEKEIPIILHHHERYDGSGYPQGLRGREIPLGARILSVVDAFDAMTTDRGFQAKKPVCDVLQEMRQASGSQFDPNVVEAFMSIAESLSGNTFRTHGQERVR